MNLTNSKQRSKVILEDLEARFLEGERLTIEGIIKEYFNTNNTLQYMNARDTVRQYLHTLKPRFTKTHDLWFGSINDLGEFGICLTKAEYTYTITRYFAFIRGNVVRTNQLGQEAMGKGLLGSGFKDVNLRLPAPTPKKEEDK